jgi:hypothetical protein
VKKHAIVWSLIAIVLASAIAFVFQANALASLAVSSVAAEFCMGKAGIVWTAVPAGKRAMPFVIEGAVYGTTFGVGALILTAKGLSLTVPEVSELAAGLVSALLLALRNELIEHALIRHACPKRGRVQLALMVVATLAWTYGSSRRFDAHALAHAGAIGCISAALWQRHAFAGIAARFAFVTVSTVVARNVARAADSTVFSSAMLLAVAIGVSLWLSKTSTSPADPNVAQQS